MNAYPEKLVIEAGKDTPRICFDAEAKLLEIAGDSYPENAALFYGPVFAWLEHFLQLLRDAPRHGGATLAKTLVRIQVNYLNSSSSKVMLNFFDRLDAAVAEGLPMEVQWLYFRGNETLHECGEEFSDDLQCLPFALVPIDSEDNTR